MRAVLIVVALALAAQAQDTLNSTRDHLGATPLHNAVWARCAEKRKSPLS
jgi:hypothetical protein